MEQDDDFDNTEEREGTLNQSIRKYEEMKEKREKYFFDVDALLKLIDHFIEKLCYEKAFEVTRYAHTLHPGSISFTLKEAHLLSLMGKEKDALRLLETVEHVNPFDLEVHLIRGNIYNSLEQYERAIASFRKALEMADEQKDDIYLSLAITYQNMGEYSRAVDYYKLCLLENPANEVAMEEMIISLDLSHRLNEGISFFRKLIDEQPYGYMLWYYLGDLHTRTNQFTEAISAYDYCLLIREDFAPAHLDMAHAHAFSEQFREAIDRYKLAFEYCQPDAFTYYNLGECHENLKEYEQARNYYRKAVKQMPEMAQAWYGIGVTFEEEERWYEALHYIRKALELDDQNGEYWLALGDCEYRLNNFSEAEECYRKVIDYDPESLEGWMAFGDLLLEQNRASEALDLVESGLMYHPKQADLLFRQVCYLYQAGQIQESYQRLAAALDEHPDAGWILFDLLPALEYDHQIQELIHQKGKTT